MKFASPSTLRKQGILGMNARNFQFIMASNKRHFYPRVDDKMQTKNLAIEAGLAVPELICCIRYNHQLKELHDVLDKHEEFVVKPTKGCAGKGIIVVKGKTEEGYLKASGTLIPFTEMNRHVSSILTGLYSLGGQRDRAMVEKLVHFTDTFNNFTYQGVPDIRVIIYKGYPVMAMTRLSTAVSDGKANLHQGAVGVGLDIATGKAIQAVQFNKVVDKHPDTGFAFDNLVIPDWDKILQLSAKSYEITELGYMGADIVLDKARGPLILELNARPGLSIQIANGCGLWNRLSLIDGESKAKRHSDERVAFAKEAFGNK
ncbi:MAG: alpha-L-glutamate ligase-like protein [Lentisphaeraceae bacterium]|nr:alpha-L-glutamate ligase-like protein [Lentisphaeraceae bacterium]